jgi:hypothetical protein
MMGARAEGPTKTQAKRLAAYRAVLLKAASMAMAAGDDAMSYECDCEAFDIESVLVTYGFGKATE